MMRTGRTIEDEEAPDNGGTTGSASQAAATWPDIREGSELPVTSLSITEGKNKTAGLFYRRHADRGNGEPSTVYAA